MASRRDFISGVTAVGTSAIVSGQARSGSDARIRVLGNRQSIFYAPFIATVAGGFLKAEGLEPSFTWPGSQNVLEAVRSGAADVTQSAVSSYWTASEAGGKDLPVHIAQINQRDGFFLLRRGPKARFEWRELEGKTLLADRGGQPLLMLRYALDYHHVDWSKVKVIDDPSPAALYDKFKSGAGDFVHLQGPAPQQLEIDKLGAEAASLGASTPLVAFSSVAASREFLRTPKYQAFLRAFAKAKTWAQNAPAREIAEKEEQYVPGFSREALTAAIARYQAIATWKGGIEIPQDQYEQAQKIFSWGAAIKQTHRYEEVCASPSK
ncbi:MAG: ABC transporter substrate-binding protein [Candidatus Binataceae bacterium]